MTTARKTVAPATYPRFLGLGPRPRLAVSARGDGVGQSGNEDASRTGHGAKIGAAGAFHQ